MSSAAKTGVQINTGQAVGALRKLNTALGAAISNFDKLQMALGRTATVARQTGGSLDSFQKKTSKSSGLVSGLTKKLGHLATAYFSVQTAQKLIGEADIYTNNMARLNVMNDGLQTTDELYHKIYQSAQRSRSPMNEVAATVSKLGIVAKDAFSSNDEIIAFTETFNKAAMLSGASHSERANAMYQLSQAFASGKLQGDELRSVRENAPLIFKAIEDEMKKEFRDGIDVKDLAAKGLVKPDIIKRAALKTAKDIETAYKNMPMTFEQMTTQGLNKIRKALEPILKEMRDLFNSPEFKKGFNDIVNGIARGMYIAWDFLKETGRVIGSVIKVVNDLKWAILSLIGVIGIWKIVTLANLAIQKTVAIITGILTFIESVRRVGIGMTILMYTGLNQVQLKNLAINIMWVAIIVAIIALIAAVIYWLDYLMGAVYWCGAAITNAWLWIKDTVNVCWIGMQLASQKALSAILKFALTVAEKIANAFVTAFNGVIGLINNLVGKIGDTKLGEKLGLNGLKIKEMKKVDLVGSNELLQGSLATEKDLEKKLNAAMVSKPEYKNLGEAYDKGKAKGEAMQQSMKDGFNSIKDKMGFGGSDDPNKIGKDLSDEGLDAKYGKIGDIDSFGKDPTQDALNKNTKALNDNTSAVNGKEDDNYELMLEVMRQRAINRVGNSGGVVKIEMVNNNNLNSKLDVKGFITEMVNAITEAASTSAQGVHN